MRHRKFSETTEGRSKKTKKRDKYLDIVRELKRLCNVKVTVIPM